jgi:hypothetical protein
MSERGREVDPSGNLARDDVASPENRAHAIDYERDHLGSVDSGAAQSK